MLENSFTKSPSFFHIHIQDTRSHFGMWRAFDLASSVFSLSGIIFCLIDYEITISNKRDYNNCKKEPEIGILRILTLISTVMSIFFIFLRYYEKSKWKQLIYKHTQNPMYIKGRKNDFLLGIEILILCLFPYPYVDAKIYVPLRFTMEDRLICYNLSEVLYCFMYLRFFWILRAPVFYSKYQNLVTRSFDYDFRYKPNLRFLVKCLLFDHPITFLSTISVLSLCIFSLTYRVFERPADELSHFYYRNPLNALWFMVENMTTLGYGDFYPITYPGRIICVISYCAGAVLFFFMIIAIQQKVELNVHQTKAYVTIRKIPQSAAVIKYFVRYCIAKKKYGRNDYLTAVSYLELMNCVKNLKNIKSEVKSMFNKNTEFMKKDIRIIRLRLRKLDSIVSGAIKHLTNT